MPAAPTQAISPRSQPGRPHRSPPPQAAGHDQATGPRPAPGIGLKPAQRGDPDGMRTRMPMPPPPDPDHSPTPPKENRRRTDMTTTMPTTAPRPVPTGSKRAPMTSLRKTALVAGIFY